MSGSVLSRSANVIPATGNPSIDLSSTTVGSIEPYIQAAINSLQGGMTKATGLYVEGLMLLDVIQQPQDKAWYVSEEPESVTQFGMAAKYGSVGLLAHNYAAGARFEQINIGDRIYIAYEDGDTEGFIVSSIDKYQALSPKDPRTSFVNLSTQKNLSAEELFLKVYGGKHHLTLQTCIALGSESSWGRLFIIADPIPPNPIKN